MANIIPAAYFGLPALGQLGQQVGETVLGVKELQRKRKKDEQVEALQEIATLQALFPNNPEVWAQRAQELGLVPQGLERRKSTGETLIEMGRDPTTGRTVEQTVKSADLGITGEQQAVDLNAARLREVDYAEMTRKAYDDFLVEQGIGGRGVLEAMGSIQDFEMGKLQMDATKLNMEATKLGMRLSKAQLDRINKELAMMAASGDPDVDWYEMVSKATFYAPSVLKGTFTKKPELWDDTDKRIVARVQGLMDTARAEALSKLQDARTSPAADLLNNLAQTAKLMPDAVPMSLMEDAADQLLTAAGLVKTERDKPRLWGLLGSSKVTEWSLPTGIQKVAIAQEAIGQDPNKPPPLPQERAAEYAKIALDLEKGDVKKALARIERIKDNLSAEEYKAIREAIQPATTPITSPAVEPPKSAEKAATEAKPSKAKPAGADPYGDVPNKNRTSEYQKDQIKLKAIDIKIKKAEKDLADAEAKRNKAKNQDAYAIMGRTAAQREENLRKLKEEKADLEKQIQEKIKKAGA